LYFPEIHMLRKTLTVMTLLLSASMAAQAAPCSAELTGNDAMKFDKANIEVPKSCKEFTIKLSHSGKLATNVMGHNVVIAKTADIRWRGHRWHGRRPGGRLRETRRCARGGAQQGDRRRAEHHGDLPGGQDHGAPYSFFCTFPGHWAMMKGTLTVK